MGYADCIGHTAVERSYIFAMLFGGRFMMQVPCLLALAVTLRADPGDTEGAKDYPGFPRIAGFVISDYDEDNPAEFDFPVARPTLGDSNNVETIHVRGHRYVIRYELGSATRLPTLYQTQLYYEKLAANAGFTIEKNGAVGDVSETFRKTNGSHEIWVCLEPAVTSNVLTIVESNTAVPLTPAENPSQPAPATPPPAPVVAMTPSQGEPSVSVPQPTASIAVPSAGDDSLFDSLKENGRIIIPFSFTPGKDDLDPSSQPLVARVATMLQRHPDLYLRIEGHTDNSGDPDINLRLSALRAIAIQTALVDEGIQKKRLDPVGVGGLQPLASNATAEGREENRRIELVIWKMYPMAHTNSNQQQ
jgi:outer membrane protein OmpA-like peptidoglycan-associated protein